MTIDAIAVLRIPLGTMRAVFQLEGRHDDGLFVLRGGHGAPMGVKGLEDGCLLYTGVRYDSEPVELGRAIRRMLGDLLDRHEEARGVYVFPDVATPSATSCEGVVAELGEGGEWVPRSSAESAAPVPDLASLAKNLMAAMPPEAMSQLTALAGQLGLGAFGSGMGPGVVAGVSELLKKPGVGDALVDAAKKVQGQLGEALPAALPSLEAAPDLLEQARRAAAELGPERLAELERRFRSGGSAGDEGADPDAEG